LRFEGRRRFLLSPPLSFFDLVAVLISELFAILALLLISSAVSIHAVPTSTGIVLGT
jgi:hypothetical protein